MELVVTCTKRKRGPVHPASQFRSLPILPPDELAREWLARAAHAGAKKPVSQLYAGGGWCAAQGAYAAARKLGGCRLHILSAGFGLVSPEEMIAPYSATFAADA